MAKQTKTQPAACTLRPVSSNTVVHRLREFAEKWNDKRIRTRHELLRRFQDKQRGILPTWKQVWKMRGEYNHYLKKHPELLESRTTINIRGHPKAHTDQPTLLPRLIIRQYETGEPKELHPLVEQHLDEWKYPRKRIKRALGFVIGCYQWGSVPARVIATAKVYAKQRGFEFIVGLSQYGRIEIDRETDELLSVLPEELRGHIVVDNVTMADFKLDCNTHLVQTSDRYLTDSVCEIAGEQSTIFLGTKQEMRHLMRLEHEYPACYVTTGSLNEPHHKRTRLGKHNKAVAVAKARHEYGFVVLEIVCDRVHGAFAIPRQLWATADGVVYDIDPVHGGARIYTPDGHTHCPDGIDTLKSGDVHAAGIDETIWRVTYARKDSIAKVLQPKYVHVGDTFDNRWGNPFRSKQTMRAAYQAQHGMNNMRHELEATKRLLTHLWKTLPERTRCIVHEPSNHSDDWLSRWLNEGQPHDDPLNGPLWCELWLVVYEALQREGRLMNQRRS